MTAREPEPPQGTTPSSDTAAAGQGLIHLVGAGAMKGELSTGEREGDTAEALRGGTPSGQVTAAGSTATEVERDSSDISPFARELRQGGTEHGAVGALGAPYDHEGERV